MPEIHEAMETEARERLAQFIPLEDQERLGIQIALATGPADQEVVRYANDHGIDLAIVQARADDAPSMDMARAVLDGTTCAVLVLR